MHQTPFPPPKPFRTAALSLALAAAVLLPARAGVVELDQDLAVKPGWNAVYVEVAPSAGSLDEIFGGWPTDSVGLYDPASFLSTRQHTASSESQGMAIAPIAMWHRDHPAASDALSLPANTVCIFFATNPAASTVTVRGIPAAPRTTWHATGPKKPYNFFGLSLQTGATATPADCLDGFPGIHSISGIYRLYGTNGAVSPSMTRIYATTKLYDGNVLLVPSSEISDWAGVFFVSPMDGLDYGTNATLRTLSVRNDGTQTRTASIDLVSVPGSRNLLSSLHLRDSDIALTNASWTVPASPRLASKSLEPGETWTLEFGLDRTAFDGDVLGTPFGAVLRITDDGGASKWRVDVPLKGEASGRSAESDAWPGGLWVAEAEFDSIRFAGDADDDFTETGGTLKVRLPVHIDADGHARLLQRVVVGGATATDGTFAYTLYAGDATVPSTSREVMRISSAVLPTETPIIDSSADFSSGVAVFSFAVADDGATSLLRHPLHPQHDGLEWDFTTPAPSGDDWENYRSSVKPETFSVLNTISLQIDLDGGETRWNPENTKTGLCYWDLAGLRHEGPITLRGRMVINRVAPHSELVTQ